MLLQKQVVDALLKPAAYNEDPGSIDLVQTHISFVFLTKRFVYKMKKAVDFGFLDFTTLEKRRFFCEKELELNRRLCRDMYLEVVSINRADGIKINGPGETVEYAVKMKRMPQETMLKRLIEKNKANPAIIERIAKTLSAFHAKAETNIRISTFGSLAVVGGNWQENFVQTQEYINKTIPSSEFQLIRGSVEAFMENNSRNFKKRITEGRIRDCHGDIHSDNIFVAGQIYIFDAIEFNERFRYCDIASDIAFLAMDLDFKERPELSALFVEKYVTYSGDRDLLNFLRFYKCYRAYVRGKVVSFKLKDPHVSSAEKRKAKKEAMAYFKLAATYAKSL